MAREFHRFFGETPKDRPGPHEAAFGAPKFRRIFRETEGCHACARSPRSPLSDNSSLNDRNRKVQLGR
jgi:hypothetical protein